MTMFDPPLKTIAKEVEKDMADIGDKLYRAKVLKTFTGIVTKTPVDTGRARSNWFVTANVPYRGSVVGTEGQQINRTVDMGAVRSGKQEFATFYLTNNLPYIERLEFGYSNQAPSGMIRLTFAEQGLS